MNQDELAQAIELTEYEAIQLRAIQPETQAPSLSHCKACGDEIPQARQAIKGITRCIDCQEEYEKTIKRGLLR